MSRVITEASVCENTVSWYSKYGDKDSLLGKNFIFPYAPELLGEQGSRTS